MPSQHVIIGGGPVATNAIETIRQFDTESDITLISDEPAHSRMALPYWLSGQVPREHTHTADDAMYQKLNVTAKIGVRVTNIDPQANTLTLCDGSSQPFDKLLIGTGAAPLPLPIPGADLPGVQQLWKLEHTESLLKLAANHEKPRVVMIGAGFIGFIMLNAMHKRGWDLTVVEREAQVLPRMLDADSAMLVQDWLKSQNVDLHLGCSVQEIQANDDGSKQVMLDNGDQVAADIVVVAIGIQPNTQFLDGSGIETDEAILVNNQMQTNFPHIYAGGDCAQGPALYSDNREVHPIQPTAVDHGRVAGANMAGEAIHYPGSLLMNVLDVCGLQTSSFGNWSDASAETTTICNAAGSVYRKYLWTGDQITGVIFVGRPNDMGMLTDVGMVKGILQTQTPLGSWKEFLQENPFDIRRPYVANKVAQKLVSTTLLGQAAKARSFRFKNTQVETNLGPSHASYVGTKEE